MLGSGHWVDSTAVPQDLAIAAAFNLDMFGYTPYDTTMLYMTRNAASLELSVLAESANAWYDIGLNVVNFLDEDCAGDNAPFWDHGYRSVFACEDSEYGIWNGSDPAYHTPGDTFGYVRMGQVTRTTKLSASCIGALATPCTVTGISEAGPVLPARAKAGSAPSAADESSAEKTRSAEMQAGSHGWTIISRANGTTARNSGPWRAS